MAQSGQSEQPWLAVELGEPDGLFLIESYDPPDLLHELSLSDFTGHRPRQA